MKALRDYTKEELDRLENELGGFIHGFGFSFSKEYTGLVVAVKAKMEVEKCDYLNRPEPLPVDEMEANCLAYKKLRKEVFALGQRLVDTIRPGVLEALEEKDFDKAYALCDTAPDCYGRVILINRIMDAEDLHKKEG